MRLIQHRIVSKLRFRHDSGCQKSQACLFDIQQGGAEFSHDDSKFSVNFSESKTFYMGFPRRFAPTGKRGRLRAPSVADAASKKEWQRSKFAATCPVRRTSFENRNRDSRIRKVAEPPTATASR